MKSKKVENRFFLGRKKAAIGATITWVVATIIILVVIILFVYASEALAVPGKTKKEIIEGPETSFSNLGREMDKQQTLRALLKTEIDGKKVEDYISKGDYESLKNKLNPILEKFPVPSDGYWVFLVYEGDNEKLRIGKTFTYVRYTAAFVYRSNKKIEFRWEDNII